MSKTFKLILYIAGCTVVFLLLVRVYNNSLNSSNTANAFEWEKQVQVYFGNPKIAGDNVGNEDCSKVFPLTRTILNAETLGPGSLEALLKGVSAKEEDQGYETALNKDVLVQRFDIEGGVAYIDFNSKFNEGVAGACRIEAIRSQIGTTLLALPDIDSVVLSVNGETTGILEP